jgi:hypothetical protein
MGGDDLSDVGNFGRSLSSSPTNRDPYHGLEVLALQRKNH